MRGEVVTISSTEEEHCHLVRWRAWKENNRDEKRDAEWRRRSSH